MVKRIRGPSLKKRSSHRYGFENKLSRGGTWRRRSRRNTLSKDNVVDEKKRGQRVEPRDTKRKGKEIKRDPSEGTSQSHRISRLLVDQLANLRKKETPSDTCNNAAMHMKAA